MSNILLFCLSLVLVISTSVLAANKVVVIPLNSPGTSNKLWGEGREGTSTTVNTTANGITIARSNGTASWDGAAAACPKNTWVCSLAEVQNLSTSSPTPTMSYMWCDGTNTYLTRFSWVRNQANDPNQGRVVAVYDAYDPGVYVIYDTSFTKCDHLPVWCCSSAN